MKITVDYLQLDQIESVLFQGEKITLEAAALNSVKAGFDFLKKFSEEKLIYGINTGFGPMAQYRVSDEFREQLQYNIIRSHSTGAGALLPPMYVKAVMLARLCTFIQGYSGVHPEVVELLVEFINRDITPLIFEHGSVGASGDLVQLAHIALCLIGEGEVIYNDERRPAKDVLAQLGLKPIRMYIREGLALANGTSAMTGIGLINLIYAKKLLNLAVIASCMVNEITASFDDYFSLELNRTKWHAGQQLVAAKMRNVLSGSGRIRKREEFFYKQRTDEEYIRDKVQEYYSLRCVPQILGPIQDEIDNAEKVLLNEINSASDNPIVDRVAGNVFHGGNFHGDYISYEMDKLKIAVTRLTMLSERQMNYLFHDRINNILPPFVNLGVKGLNYGLQAAQFTATSTTAESQTLSNPMYVHSIPNNNDNQDIVSMGTNSAQIAKTVIENAFQVLSIHFMAIVQAIDYLKIYNDLSGTAKEFYTDIRAFFPVFVEDTPKYEDIARMNRYLKEKNIHIE
ncbi:MAG: aromatic amino acid ammonia-lyase [Dysgonamonadaceae bacterium]|jgi:histidine ammonia-lyase|nr:aromatic amino acid ammonia-lyase [Dysgonamonadaceae bacterium]